MPILGVVLTHPSPTSLVAAVRAIPEVAALGEPTPNRLPLVLHTTDKRADEPVLDALRALPGVLAVDLAFADFSDLVSDPVAPVSP
jgi:nitrate reductase NapAB chaperone NapD